MDNSSHNQFEALRNEIEELGNFTTIPTSNLDNISESMSIVSDLDVPIAIRKGIGNCTKYPIAPKSVSHKAFETTWSIDP